MNISSSSAQSTVLLPAANKKLRSTAGNSSAVSAKAGPPACPALVATERNVQLHTATHTIVSSSSSISVTSSVERARRYETARAAVALAEARMEPIHATNEMAAGSQAGSVGRRLDDVQSEVGSNYDLQTTLHTDGVRPTPPTVENPFEGVFSQSGPTPSIYDVFSLNRGVHIIDELGVADRLTDDGSAVSAKAGLTTSSGSAVSAKAGPSPTSGRAA